MKFKVFLGGVAALGLHLALASTAAANPAFMTASGATNPPIGHYEFCRRLPDECRANASAGRPLALTRARWKTMLEVNYLANTSVRAMTDMEVNGVEEYWSYPQTAGDCEDFVLLKRKMLMSRGFPASDLLITVVLQPNGEGHAVLTVTTDHGDFVLDNMRGKVMLWSDTEYTFLKRQSPLHAARWEKIRDTTRSPLVSSVR